MRSRSILDAVQVFLDLLVEGSYEVVEAMTRGRRLSAGDLRMAIDNYGDPLVPVPERDLESLDVVKIEGTDCPTFHVVVDLWTLQEGRSDLSLELRLTDLHEGTYDIEVLDLHAL